MDVPDINVGNISKRTPQLAIFDFRSFLDLAMLLVESQPAKSLRQIMLDIVIDFINQKAGGGTKYINQRDSQFLGAFLQEENYRREFTDALRDYVDMGNAKYGIYTDKIYQSIFRQKAKVYRQILRLSDKEKVRDTNKKQTRQDWKIKDYFEHVAGKEQDMEVEIIIQIGDMEFWKQFDDMKSYMKLSYQIILDELRKRLPQFVVANAVVHLDEDSPHMHIVGVPVADGYKKGLSKQVSKRKVFTKDVLSRVLQAELREVENKEVTDWFGKQIKEKSKGRNHDLSVAEYKVAQETKHLEQIQEQMQDADIKLTASQIVYRELERRRTKELDEKMSELQSVKQELASVADKANEAIEPLDKINAFVSSFRLFAPTIEEYANHVEADKTIEAGNSFRGILSELGKLLETFKKLIKEGLCCFSRLMRWKTSKGEVAPVFIEKSNGYSYSVYGYVNVETKEYYSKDMIQ